MTTFKSFILQLEVVWVYTLIASFFIRNKGVTQGRSLVLLEHDYVDVILLGTNVERELRYLPISIPLFRGLLGYRVSLISQENKDKFFRIRRQHS